MSAGEEIGPGDREMDSCAWLVVDGHFINNYSPYMDLIRAGRNEKPFVLALPSKEIEYPNTRAIE